MTNGSPVHEALAHLEANFDGFKKTLIELSKIPSISASPFPPEEVRRSAEATADALRAVGVENVEVLSIDGVHPYVYGDFMHTKGAPTVLLYGHHDVQPVGNEARWAAQTSEACVEGDAEMVRTRRPCRSWIRYSVATGRSGVLARWIEVEDGTNRHQSNTVLESVPTNLR
mgnify:CR=1 FL=1